MILHMSLETAYQVMPIFRSLKSSLANFLIEFQSSASIHDLMKPQPIYIQGVVSSAVYILLK